VELPGQGRPQLWEDSEANEDESHGKGRLDRPQDGTVPSGPSRSNDWSESGNSVARLEAARVVSEPVADSSGSAAPQSPGGRVQQSPRGRVHRLVARLDAVRVVSEPVADSSGSAAPQPLREKCSSLLEGERTCSLLDLMLPEWSVNLWQTRVAGSVHQSPRGGVHRLEE